MRSDTARTWGNGGARGRLEDMVTPLRERLEDTARDVTEALSKAGEAVKKIRPEDVAEMMRRSPLTALLMAAGIGLIAGLFLWPRER